MSEEQEIQDIRSHIQEAYVLNLLRTGKNPISVLQFVEGINISEADFYEHFNSFKSIEKSVWHSFIIETIEVLENDSEYPSYSAREKTLAFYYTFIEVLKQNRSLVLYRLEGLNFLKGGIPFYLSDFFSEFKGYMNTIIHEGTENEEIIARPLITEQYVQVYKVLMGYLLKVWIGDSSENYQTTDAAIEKSVNLTFDLLQKGPLDSMIDFAKFAIQNKAF